jgi:hypothetical protein
MTVASACALLTHAHIDDEAMTCKEILRAILGVVCSIDVSQLNAVAAAASLIVM